MKIDPSLFSKALALIRPRSKLGFANAGSLRITPLVDELAMVCTDFDRTMGTSIPYSLAKNEKLLPNQQWLVSFQEMANTVNCLGQWPSLSLAPSDGKLQLSAGSARVNVKVATEGPPMLEPPKCNGIPSVIDSGNARLLATAGKFSSLYKSGREELESVFCDGDTSFVTDGRRIQACQTPLIKAERTAISLLDAETASHFIESRLGGEDAKIETDGRLVRIMVGKSFMIFRMTESKVPGISSILLDSETNAKVSFSINRADFLNGLAAVASVAVGEQNWVELSANQIGLNISHNKDASCDLFFEESDVESDVSVRLNADYLKLKISSMMAEKVTFKIRDGNSPVLITGDAIDGIHVIQVVRI